MGNLFKQLLRYIINPFKRGGAMKRSVVIILLAVVLSLSLGFGVAYAAGSHNPAQGSKLVGVGQLGKLDYSYGYQQSTTEFQFTNTDCIKEVTIDQVSIIASDGTVIYEGPYISVEDDFREIKTTLLPHEVEVIRLDEYMYIGGNQEDPASWLPSEGAVSGNLDFYTVEIDWSVRGVSSSLTGWFTVLRTTMEGGNKYRTMSQSQMVNLVQWRSYWGY
jgi:hypothetical protein